MKVLLFSFALFFFYLNNTALAFCENVQTTTQEFCCNVDFLDSTVLYDGLNMRAIFSSHLDVDLSIQQFENRLDRIRNFCTTASLATQFGFQINGDENNDNPLNIADIFIETEEDIVSPLLDFEEPSSVPSIPSINDDFVSFFPMNNSEETSITLAFSAEENSVLTSLRLFFANTLQNLVAAVIFYTR